MVVYGRGTIGTGQVEGVKEYKRDRAPSGGGSNPNLIADLCRSMQTEGSCTLWKTCIRCFGVCWI